MKTTILLWGRAEGKTEALIDRLHDHRIGSLNKLLITHNQKEIDRLKREYRFPMNTLALSFISLGNGLARGMKPEMIFIDNAEFLEDTIFFDEIVPMLSNVKELVVSSSDRRMLELFNHEVFS